MGMGSHEIPMGMGTRSIVGWEWDGNEVHGRELRRGSGKTLQALPTVFLLALLHRSNLRPYDHYN